MSSSWPDHHSISYTDVFKFMTNKSTKGGNSCQCQTSPIMLPHLQPNHQCWVIRLEALKLFSTGFKAPWKEVCGVLGSCCHTIAVLSAEIETLCSRLFSQNNSLSSGSKCSVLRSLCGLERGFCCTVYCRHWDQNPLLSLYCQQREPGRTIISCINTYLVARRIFFLLSYIGCWIHNIWTC